jgi:large subunit ribosomal protein L5
MTRLQEKYLNTAVPALKEKFGFKNNMAVPRIVKVTLNTGIGKYRGDQKIIDEIEKDMTQIAGQKAVFTQAKKAIASFKSRQGQIIGIKVTLRGEKMYSFLDRFVSLALPRTRDLRGIPVSAVDSNGNLNVGMKEQIVFPEISHENVKIIFGLEISVSTTAKNEKEGLELFKQLGFPIK